MTRNIGLPVPEPKKEADPDDKNNPFMEPLQLEENYLREL